MLNRIRELEAQVKELKDKLDVATQSGRDDVLSPSSVVRSPSPKATRVQDKDIQDWINQARESANVSGDLDPSAVSTVDELERLSTQEDSDDGDDDDGLPEASPEPLLRVEGTTRSPAVGTTLSPIGLIASSALRKGRKGGSTGSASVDGDRDIGVANASYFRPGE